MNEHLVNLLLVLFVILPPALLSLRMFPRRPLPWWAVVTLMVGAGWGLVLGAATLAETPERGSAAMALGLFFGWAYALVWFAPWLALYGIVSLLRRRRGGPDRRHQHAGFHDRGRGAGPA